MNPERRSNAATLSAQMLLSLLLGSTLLIAVSCKQSDKYSPMVHQHTTEALQAKQVTSSRLLVEPLYKFTTNLLRTPIRNPEENVIFSPLSIHTALNMLSLGVTKTSQTSKDFHETLGYANITAKPAEIHEANSQLRSVFDEIKSTRESSGSRASNRNPKLDMMNFVIVSKSAISPNYVNETNKYYGAAARQIRSDLDRRQVLDEVNKWGKEAGFSDNILPEAELAKSALMLLNGVRLEAFWFDEFHERILDDKPRSPLYKWQEASGDSPAGQKVLTRRELMINYVEFTKSGVSMRANQSEPGYDELAALEFRAIKIPLIGDLSYTIIEPLARNASHAGLAKLEEALMQPEGGRLERVMSIVDAPVHRVAANIWMPGFKFEREIDLKAPLSSMGLARLFDASTAELGEMGGAQHGALYVDEAKHKAMIEVNEKGLKAAAVTRVMVLLTAISHRRVIDVFVENPFLYVIRLDQVPLFVGHLVKA